MIFENAPQIDFILEEKEFKNHIFSTATIEVLKYASSFSKYFISEFNEKEKCLNAIADFLTISLDNILLIEFGDMIIFKIKDKDIFDLILLQFI